jgi:hypothetical protein
VRRLRRAACSEPRPGDVDRAARQDRGHPVLEEVERRGSLEGVTPLEFDPARDHLRSPERSGSRVEDEELIAGRILLVAQVLPRPVS